MGVRVIRPLIVILTPVLLLFAACGDGGGAATPASSTTPIGPTPTVTPTATSSGLPTPKPAGNTDRALTVAARGKAFEPTVADFRALPQTEITTTEGKKSGVLLSVLAAKVETLGTDVVTIEGRPADQRQGGFVRGLLSELASTTVFYINDKGHVGLASSSLPVEQWLSYVVTLTISK